MARLDCQDMTCEASEKILQRHSPREALAALGIPGSSGSGQRKPSQGQEIVDVNSRLFLVSKNDGQVVAPCRGLQRYTSGLDTEDEIEEGNSPRRNGFSIQSSFLDVAALQHGSPSTSKGKSEYQVVRVNCYFVLAWQSSISRWILCNELVALQQPPH